MQLFHYSASSARALWKTPSQSTSSYKLQTWKHYQPSRKASRESSIPKSINTPLRSPLSMILQGRQASLDASACSSLLACKYCKYCQKSIILTVSEVFRLEYAIQRDEIINPGLVSDPRPSLDYFFSSTTWSTSCLWDSRCLTSTSYCLFSEFDNQLRL